MTIFVILMPSLQPTLAAKIKEKFSSDHLAITETQWLISTTGTVTDLSATLGIYDPKNPAATPTGQGVVFATSAYFGRAPTTVWDWLRAKLETSPNG
jgi:hypothetical protein